LFFGTVDGSAPSSVTVDPTGKGMLLSLSAYWDATRSVTPTATSTDAGSRFSILTSFFSGPSTYSRPDDGIELSGVLAFQNFGNDYVRLDSLEGTWVTSKSQSLAVSGGFRARAADAWARLTLNMERDMNPGGQPSDWSGGGYLGNFTLGSQ